MNTRLQAICDSQGRPLNQSVAAVIILAHGRLSAACRRSIGYSVTAGMTPTGSEKRCKTKGYAPAYPAESNARLQFGSVGGQTMSAEISAILQTTEDAWGSENFQIQ